MRKKGRVAALIWFVLGLAAAGGALIVEVSNLTLLAAAAGLLVAFSALVVLARPDGSNALVFAVVLAALSGATLLALAFWETFPVLARFRVALAGLLMVIIAVYEAMSWRNFGSSGLPS